MQYGRAAGSAEEAHKIIDAMDGKVPF